jgi:hypothetical protein
LLTQRIKTTKPIVLYEISYLVNFKKLLAFRFELRILNILKIHLQSYVYVDPTIAIFFRFITKRFTHNHESEQHTYNKFQIILDMYKNYV